MKVRSTDFRVEEGQKIHLDKWPTSVEPVYESKKQYQKLLSNHVAQLSSLQQLLYASNRYALLLIFQAMDAAGKDGAIKHVMSGVNPQGCQVFSYRHPSATELPHDFLWRAHRHPPHRGGPATSTGPTCRKCSSSACTQRFSAVSALQMGRSTTRPSGRGDFSRS